MASSGASRGRAVRWELVPALVLPCALASRSGVLAVGGAELGEVLEDGPELKAQAGHQPGGKCI